MPEYLRALVIVLALCAGAAFALRPCFEPLMPEGAYGRRRNAVLALIASAFLAPNFWVYALLASVILLRARRFEGASCAIFFSVLYVVPPSVAYVPGFGIANFLLALDHPRLVALLVLLPLLPTALRAPRVDETRLPDRLVLAYFLFQAGLAVARDESFTNGLRSVVYAFLGIALPYFVVSRTLTRWRDIGDAMALLCMTGAMLGAIGMFEAGRHWLLFKPMTEHWGSPELGNYLARAGVVRASASTGQPIVLGYVLVVAFACLLGLRARMRGWRRLLCATLILGGLLATFSRGPWLGAAAAAATYWAAATPTRFRAAVAASAAWLTAFFVFDLRPVPSALSDVDQSTVDYRTQLLNASMTVFRKSPWFGSESFRRDLADLGMVQGQGIVDVVNSYIQIALSSGIIGLVLFTAVMLGVVGCVRRVLRLAQSGPEQAGGEQPGDASSRGANARHGFEAARAMLAAVVGTIVTIATVSSISFIPWTYWGLLGLGVACARIACGSPARQPQADASVEPIGPLPAPRPAATLLRRCDAGP